jgi:hypothetical protein
MENMEKRAIDPMQVKGWGIDANPDNDPTYPMKNRNNGEHAGYSWERPPQQPVNVEVLHSNERPNVSAAFGTSTPPAGLSGMIRRFAFRYSESSYGHWLPLMLADRVGVVEGRVEAQQKKSGDEGCRRGGAGRRSGRLPAERKRQKG